MSAAALTLAEAVGVYRLGLGVTGFFAAVAVGLCIYAALLVRTVIAVRTSDASLAMTT
jgi:hypothetical protein